MAASNTRSGKKGAAGKPSPTNNFHESINSPDELISVHSLICFAKEACQAEEAIEFLFEVYPDASFLKTCTEAVKVLPDHIKATEEIIERYGNNSKSTQGTSPRLTL